jgi:hypothetical protein
MVGYEEAFRPWTTRLYASWSARKCRLIQSCLLIQVYSQMHNPGADMGLPEIVRCCLLMREMGVMNGCVGSEEKREH